MLSAYLESCYENYFDYNATTPISVSCRNGISRAFDFFENPSSRHRRSGKAREIIRLAKKNMANVLGADPSNIFFTSGGTESNNWAIHSALSKYTNNPGQIISSSIEHPSVLSVLQWYCERFGFEVTLIEPTREGSVQVDEVLSSVQDNCQLVTIMAANNETGALQPIDEISKFLDSKGVAVHTDGVQIVGKRQIDVTKSKFDYFSFSAHKFYGPKGIGGLYCKNPETLVPLILGGGQEDGFRSGTENILGISGLAEAAAECLESGETWQNNSNNHKKYLLDRLTASNIEFKVNGSICPTKTLTNTINIQFIGYRAEALAFFLEHDSNHVVSLGSACSNNGNKILSHVLKAMKLTDKQCQSSMRISIGRYTSRRSVDNLVDTLKKALNHLASVDL